MCNIDTNREYSPSTFPLDELNKLEPSHLFLVGLSDPHKRRNCNIGVKAAAVTTMSNTVVSSKSDSCLDHIQVVTSLVSM